MSLKDVNEFLMGGSKSVKFPTIGTSVVGRIIEPEPKKIAVLNPKTMKPETWDNGQEKEQIVVNLQTTERDPELENDDGQRRLFLKGNLQKAVAAAVRSSGAKGLAIGGVIKATYTGDGIKPSATLNAPKEFKAVYKPPAPTEVPVEEKAPAKDPGAHASSPDELSDADKEALEALMAD